MTVTPLGRAGRAHEDDSSGLMRAERKGLGGHEQRRGPERVAELLCRAQRSHLRGHRVVSEGYFGLSPLTFIKGDPVAVNSEGHCATSAHGDARR